MGKVDAFSIEGLEILFYSNDHLPPHIHIKKTGEWEIKVYLRDTTEDRLAGDLKKWSTSSPNRKTRKKIREQVVNHRSELLEEWEQKVDTDI
jgi:hypothetical protein